MRAPRRPGANDLVRFALGREPGSQDWRWAPVTALRIAERGSGLRQCRQGRCPPLRNPGLRFPGMNTWVRTALGREPGSSDWRRALLEALRVTGRRKERDVPDDGLF